MKNSVKLVRLVVSGHVGVVESQVICVGQVSNEKQLISLIVKNLSSDDQEIAKSMFERITRNNLVDNIEGNLSNDICLLGLDEENYVMILQNELADSSEQDFQKLHDQFIDNLYQLK